MRTSSRPSALYRPRKQRRRRSLLQGPSPAARSALIRRLTLLEALGPTSGLPDSTLDLERLLVLLRLWKLEIALGEDGQANEYLGQARHLCETANRKDCSDAALGRSLDARATRRPQPR